MSFAPGTFGFLIEPDPLALYTWGWLSGQGGSGELTLCDAAKDRLAEQFKNSPQLQGLICSLLSEYQDLKEVFQDLLLNRSIFTADGVQLDLLGDILGLDRYGLDDDSYRTALQSTVYLNVSNGEPETVITYLKKVTESSIVLYSESQPATIKMFYNGATVPVGLKASVKSVIAAGVGVEIVKGTEEPFAFDSEGLVDPLGLGFGEITLPTLGGQLSEKIS